MIEPHLVMLMRHEQQCDKRGKLKITKKLGILILTIFLLEDEAGVLSCLTGWLQDRRGQLIIRTGRLDTGVDQVNSINIGHCGP